MNKQLAKSLYAVGIHGITGQEIDEGYLQPGALIRNITSEECFGADIEVCEFEASTDGGRLWYRQRSYGRPICK